MLSFWITVHGVTGNVKSTALVPERRSAKMVTMATTAERSTDAQADTRRVTGARARARAEVRSAILATAAEHLATDGAADLSLRAVARDVGMVSSAIYRYFPSRNALLTALIIDAYDRLGDATEASVAASATSAPAHRWVDAAMAIRAWAIDHREDYALLYGTPVPGYAAPDDTVAPGTRVTRALVSIVADAAREGRLPASRDVTGLSVGVANRDAFEALRSELDLDAPDGVVLWAIAAWTQLFGLLTFELFGQTRGLVADDEALFRDTTHAMAARMGLPD